MVRTIRNINSQHANFGQTFLCTEVRNFRQNRFHKRSWRHFLCTKSNKLSLDVVKHLVCGSIASASQSYEKSG